MLIIIIARRKLNDLEVSILEMCPRLFILGLLR